MNDGSSGPASSRIPALDGVRGLAIALVLCVHFVRAPEGPVGNIVGRVAATGWIGVDLFFVLSGFLITGILLDSKGDRWYFRSFYIRRALRILPLYYGLIAVILLLPRAGVAAEVLGAGYLAENQWWFWTHTTNWLMASEGETQLAFAHGFGALWSLAIEEQFYLVWPLVVAACSTKGLLRVSIALVIVSAGSRIVFALLGYPAIVLYTATPMRLDALAVGALLAILARQGGLARHRLAYSWLVVSVAAVAAVVVAAGRNHPNANALIYAVAASALAAGWGAVLMLVLLRGRGSVFESGVLRSLGKYSYAIYLFQAPVDHALRRAGSGPAEVGWVGYMILGVGITCALAVVSWHVWERHWLQLKDRFPTTGPARALAPIPGQLA